MQIAPPWVAIDTIYSLFYSTTYAQRQDVNTLQIEYYYYTYIIIIGHDPFLSRARLSCINLYRASSIMHYQVLTVNEVNGFLLPLPLPLPPPKWSLINTTTLSCNCIIGNDVCLWHKYVVHVKIQFLRIYPIMDTEFMLCFDEAIT